MRVQCNNLQSDLPYVPVNFKYNGFNRFIYWVALHLYTSDVLQYVIDLQLILSSTNAIS